MPDRPTVAAAEGHSPRPPARLRLRVSNAAEQAVRGGHPWVFADSIREQNRAGTVGELAVIYDRRDRFLAAGLYDPGSPLRVRILHAGSPTQIDPAWWRDHLQRSVDLRRGLFDDRTTGYRWINGESDGWPGLVLDRYGAALVLKLYTLAWLPRLTEILGLIHETLAPARLVLRLSRNIQQAAREYYQLEDGQTLSRTGSPTAPAESEQALFLETGLRFEANIVRGQKTGFFLDQRENRRAVGELATGRAMLNAFSFSGGFSLYAARGGAKSVADLDISPVALQAASAHFALNDSDPAVRRCPHECIQADAFEWFARLDPPRFDLIVLDPPSLARKEAERPAAIEAYRRLAGGAIRRLKPGGVLVAASCSAHVSREEFFGAVRAAAGAARRSCTEMRTAGHAPDHPATFPEAQYLKSIYLRF